MGAISSLLKRLALEQYVQLVERAGGEQQVEILVCSVTGLQPSEFWRKSPAERIPYLVQSLAAEEWPDLVSLKQIAEIVNRHKKSLERYKKTMPVPAVKGGGGFPAMWQWKAVRPWLQDTFDLSELPADYPHDRHPREKDPSPKQIEQLKAHLRSQKGHLPADAGT